MRIQAFHRAILARRLFARTVLALIGLISIVFMGVGAASATSGPVQPEGVATILAHALDTEVPGVCDQARRLNAAALPQQALNLIERLRGTAPTPIAGVNPTPPVDSFEARCWRERDEALARIAVARQLAGLRPLAVALDDARAAVDAAPTPNATPDPTTSAPATADSASTTPAEALSQAVGEFRNAVAVLPPTCSGDSAANLTSADSVVAAVTAAARACDRDVEIPSDPPNKSWSESLGAQWAAFQKTYVTPLTDAALAFVLLVTGCLILARLLTRLIPTNWLELGELDRRASFWSGSLCIVLGIGLAMVNADGATQTSWWAVWLWSALAIGGVVLLAWGFSRALRVRISVLDGKGTEDQSASGHVIALLNELGATPPRGAEYPRGSDVTALQDAGLEASPQGKVLAAVYRLLQVLAPSSPWHVRVDLESEDRLAVVVNRNGRYVTSALVDRDHLRLRPPPAAKAEEGRPTVVADLYKMVAAVVLCALAGRHRMPGLGGATNWQSVGLQYIATTDLAQSDDLRRTVLARAVQIDPTNRPAQLALWHSRFRESTNREELELFARFVLNLLAGLEREGRESDEDAALRLRARLCFVAARINATYAGQPAAPPVHDPETRRNALYGLVEARTLSDHPSLGPFGARLIEPFRALVATVYRLDIDPDVDGFRTPLADYTWACHFATTSPTPRTSEAVAHLRAADAEPSLAAWREKDPQLGTLRETEAYLNTFGRAPSEDILDVPSIAHHAKRLKALGLTDAAAIVAQESAVLAPALGTTPSVAQALHDAAALALSVPAALKAWRIEITRVLLAAGVTRVIPGGSPDLVPVLVEGLSKLRKRPPKAALEAWLGTPGPAARLRRILGRQRL